VAAIAASMRRPEMAATGMVMAAQRLVPGTIPGTTVPGTIPGTLTQE
jgi:hypothetical protein